MDNLESVVAAANDHLRAGRTKEALPLLRRAATFQPANQRLIGMWAMVAHEVGAFAEAAAALQQLARLRPDDAAVFNNLGSTLGAAGNKQEAIEALRRACHLAPNKADYWYNLGKALESSTDTEGAVVAFSRVIALAPGDVKARLMRSDCLKTCGRLEESEDDLRWLLSHNPGAIEAWSRLVSLKTVQWDEASVAQLESVYRTCSPDHPYRSSLEFAYGLVLEAVGRLEDAYSVLVKANALKRASVQWNPRATTELVDRTMEAFTGEIASSAQTDLGHEAILIFGMPRSGSTLAEQILSAHPKVDGAGEVGDLSIVLAKESTRRGAPLYEWARVATSSDWTRLGTEYLTRMARYRAGGTRFTDKELGKWQLIGAARAMLPGAKFIYCERDPLETCWSCFKHEFQRDQLYSYSMEELAKYWRDCSRLVRYWTLRYPGLIHVHTHEHLLATPEAEVASLLGYCELPFHADCMAFHTIKRDVRTASAGQVRQPLSRNGPALSLRYGPLLDPLRQALGLARYPQPHGGDGGAD
jgi:tetratricopeptide (TPR) repeat protein